MICKQCKEEGKQSIVYPGMSTQTCMSYYPFYDENGVYHHHDGNTIFYDYKCSNGHEFTETSKIRCPSCDWGREVDKND